MRVWTFSLTPRRIEVACRRMLVGEPGAGPKLSKASFLGEESGDGGKPGGPWKFGTELERAIKGCGERGTMAPAEIFMKRAAAAPWCGYKIVSLTKGNKKWRPTEKSSATPTPLNSPSTLAILDPSALTRSTLVESLVQI